MHGLLSRARRWWGKPREVPALPIPYDVACSCGRPVQGSRQVRHQVVPCPGCGQLLFILPRSAYPSPEQAAPSEPAPYPFPLSFIPRPWGLPLLAAVLTLAGVALAYALVLPQLGRPGSTRESVPAAADKIEARLRAGQSALAEGSFQLALQELDAARRLRDDQPGTLSSRDSRRLDQLRREAALLAGLLRLSLQEVLHQAAGVRREEEWQAQFRDHYEGRAVIFDDVVRREADGRCYLTVYEVRVNGMPVRLELGELGLLQSLPLERPQRLLFGARLARVAREPPGVWVVRFRPDSGVLLTDEGAAAACSPLVLDDELRRLFQQQAAWAAELR